MQVSESAVLTLIKAAKEIYRQLTPLQVKTSLCRIAIYAEPLPRINPDRLFLTRQFGVFTGLHGQGFRAVILDPSFTHPKDQYREIFTTFDLEEIPSSNPLEEPIESTYLIRKPEKGSSDPDKKLTREEVDALIQKACNCSFCQHR